MCWRWEPLLDLEVRKLSAGQRRRLAFARLVAAPRPLWLLDEPFAPLDARWRAALGLLMQTHLDKGGAILAAVHDPLPIAARALDIGAGPMKGLMILFRRELALAWSGGGGPLLACGFFLCLTVLIPLAAGGDPAGLRPIAGGIAWLALALSSILSLERLFERDLEDGALDLIALGPVPLELVVLTKAKAQWLAVGVPLALTAPVAAITLGLPTSLALLVALSALIGSLGFALTGALGAALALGSRRGGLLIAVVVLPLFIPPVVFGAGALERAVNGLDPAPALAFLGAWVLFAAVVTPFAGAAVVRNAQG
jgi:heme exporter protein B